MPYKYPIDRGLIRELTERGFEIGVHGYNHDGKLFTSRAIFERRVPGIQAALDSFGVSGSEHHGPSQSGVAAALDIQYDASCFDADPFKRCPAVWAASGRSSPGGSWSCPILCRRITRCSLPSTSATVGFGKLSWMIWPSCAMALVITHPDYLDSQRRIDAYRQLLLTARDGWRLAGLAEGRGRMVAARTSRLGSANPMETGFSGTGSGPCRK